MVTFDELRITKDGHLIVSAHITKHESMENMYMKQLAIDTDKTYSPNGPSSNAVKIKLDTDERIKAFSFKISLAGFEEPRKSLFFVWVTLGGTPGVCTPCRWDEPSLAVTFDTETLYGLAMNYIKEVADTCTVPMNFIDHILQFHAMKAAIESEHYQDAIKYFNMLFGRKSTGITVKSCGCYGKSGT